MTTEPTPNQNQNRNRNRTPHPHPDPHPHPHPRPRPRPTTRLTLRPFLPADRPLLRGWITTEAELVTWAGNGFRWPLDDAQLDAYAADPGRHTWTAVPSHAAAGPDRPLGHVSLAGSRLGRVLIAPEARGRGLGEALVSLVIERAFGELGLPSLDLGVWAHNTAALRLYEKLGFHTERVLADVEQVDGVPWTAVQMRLDAARR
ncbi:GNAT family N-acetyltransferase [Streptomyces sp. NPDC091268]|uniref:GNAT family N-acetyltransferase n=1 Tax=Streptomyces sp. NPDC091268 TaxID=3365979 RepID=UPI00382C39A5